jgi:chorismate mutase
MFYRYISKQGLLSHRYHTAMSTRGIRGATQISDNSSESINSGVLELVKSMLLENSVDTDDLVSIVFTATIDLTAQFPAVAARELGLGNVPLLCSVEIDVPGALPRVIRVLMHINTDKGLKDIKHIYLHGASALRKDIAQ